MEFLHATSWNSRMRQRLVFPHAATFDLVFACEPRFCKYHLKQPPVEFLHATSWNSRMRQRLILFSHAGLVSTSGILRSSPWDYCMRQRLVSACGPCFFKYHLKQPPVEFLHATSWNSRMQQRLVFPHAATFGLVFACGPWNSRMQQPLVLYPHAGLVSASSI